MKISTPILMLLAICLIPYGAMAQSPNHSHPTAKTTLSTPIQHNIKINFAAIGSKKSILTHLENSLHSKAITLGKVSECGGFFAEDEADVENIVAVGNIGINTMDDNAIITNIVDIPDNYNIQYNQLSVNNQFAIESLSTKQYEIMKNQFKSHQLFGISHAKNKVNYNSMYKVREKSSDDLVYFYYLNQKLVALYLVSQC